MQNKKTNILYLGMGFCRNFCKVGQAQKRPYMRREKTHLQRKKGPHKKKRLIHGEKGPPYGGKEKRDSHDPHGENFFLFSRGVGRLLLSSPG